VRLPVTDGAIVRLPWDGAAGGLEDVPLTRERHRWCAHRSVRLDPTARRVYCKACGREVDAFEALQTFAAEYDRHAVAVDSLRREEQERHAAIEGLKRERANLQAQIRRLQGKLP
jgi:hypothetical protein